MQNSSIKSRQNWVIILLVYWRCRGVDSDVWFKTAFSKQRTRIKSRILVCFWIKRVATNSLFFDRLVGDDYRSESVTQCMNSNLKEETCHNEGRDCKVPNRGRWSLTPVQEWIHPPMLTFLHQPLLDIDSLYTCELYNLRSINYKGHQHVHKHQRKDRQYHANMHLHASKYHFGYHKKERHTVKRYIKPPVHHRYTILYIVSCVSNSFAASTSKQTTYSKTNHRKVTTNKRPALGC